MLYARIEGGKVAELLNTTGDISQMFAPDLVWFLADPLAAVGWSYADGVFSPPPVVGLAQMRTAALAAIDVDADAIRRAVIGERATEYQTAYDDATAFKAAGYTGTVPQSVQSWVDAKAAGGVTWTAQQAADDILTTAVQWTSAQQAIRANRLLRKEQARAASDTSGVQAALDAWAQFVSVIRTQLGVA